MNSLSKLKFDRLVQALAELVTPADLNEGRVYPPLKDIRKVSTHLATKLVEYAYREKFAFAYPEPSDKRAFVESHQYSPDYDNFMPEVYDWPEEK